MHAGQRIANGGDQIVVDVDGHVVGEQCRLQTAVVVACFGVVDVALNAASQGRGERVFVIGKLFVVLVECFAADFRDLG